MISNVGDECGVEANRWGVLLRHSCRTYYVNI